MKIYDCFQFFNELDLLEIRLELLYEHVDYFVISESNVTHSNKQKTFYFEENKKIFEKYLDKIIHIKENLPEPILSPTKKTEDSSYSKKYNEIVDIFLREDENGLKDYPTFARDYFQREFIKLGLLNCDNEDLIMVSDLDEIPNPTVVEKIKEHKLINHCVMMDCHNYFINNLAHTNWYGNYIVNYKDTLESSLTHLRNKRVKMEKLYDSGWHLSFVGGPERVRTKIESYSHQEYNHPFFLDNIQNKMHSNSDLFGRTNNTYRDENQEYFFSNLKEIKIEDYNYPKKMIDLITNKFPYLIK